MKIAIKILSDNIPVNECKNIINQAPTRQCPVRIKYIKNNTLFGFTSGSSGQARKSINSLLVKYFDKQISFEIEALEEDVKAKEIIKARHHKKTLKEAEAEKWRTKAKKKNKKVEAIARVVALKAKK